MMMNFEVLSASEAQRFQAMTFPAYRHLLALEPCFRHPEENEPRQIQPLAVGAWESGEPAGLLMAELPIEAGNDPELLSLFVPSERRGRGIATALVERLEQELEKRQFEKLVAVYMTGKPSIEVVERILEKRGWQPPVTRMVSVKFDLEKLAEAAWLRRYKLGPEFEIFPWVELGNQERDELKESHQKLGWIASDLLPWDYERTGVEPLTSVGVRYKGKVVGWVLNHQLSEDTIRYTCSFIQKTLGRMGKIVPLYGESFRRSRQAGFTQGMFVTPLYHKGMAAFAKRWFGPWSSFLGETRGAEKVLARKGASQNVNSGLTG